ncbi:MAG: glycosyltransferase family 1 protein [Pedosphaera sp.]|nr:glycosyltransferase family 1 protein [Pedosphaera sp.]
MYCGNCFRDNALVAALRALGHPTLMIPLYLPLTLDEVDQSAGTPTFFSGVNVYLQQKSAFFRNAPDWLHRFLASPAVLKWAAGRAARTRAADVGELMLSMLRGEEGYQARELEELIAWLKTQPPPGVICLSNALLVGLARRLKAGLCAPVVCMLQGEDSFLDGMTEPHRTRAWQTLAERARDVDLFIAPSHYFGDLMRGRLGLPAEKVQVVYNGINLEGYGEIQNSKFKIQNPPTLGFFARMCPEKGLDLLVAAYLELRKRSRVPGLQLKIGGGCGPGDEAFVEAQRARLREAGVLDDVMFHPNLSHADKVKFLESLDVFCTPALYGEAFGLYVIEALAAGVPVVQPRVASFPELIAATGGGVIAEPTARGLADALESLLLEPARARALGEAGRKAVLQDFSVAGMARDIVQALQTVTARPAQPPAPHP